jgi:general secretion pathway protein I
MFISRKKSRKGESGFTLLEVLVALSVLAMSYGVLLQIFGQASRSVVTTEDYRRALIVAESKLTESLAGIRSPGHQDSGIVDGRFHWQVTVKREDRYSQPGIQTFYSPALATIDVSWGDAGQSQRTISLSTIRLIRNGR